MKFYKTDYSKFIKIGEKGYTKGQEQAKIYLDAIPENDCFTIRIEEREVIEKIFQMANIKGNVNKAILLDVDNTESEKIALTIYYMLDDISAKHRTVSYKNCSAESIYELATDILSFIKSIAQ